MIKGKQGQLSQNFLKKQVNGCKNANLRIQDGGVWFKFEILKKPLLKHFTIMTRRQAEMTDALFCNTIVNAICVRRR